MSAAEPAVEAKAPALDAPRPVRPVVPMGRYEDRRQARRVRLVRTLFVVGLVAWTSLAAWWATYFYRATIAVHASKLETYAAVEALYAADFPQARSVDEFARSLPPTLALVKLPASAEATRLPFVVVPRSMYAVVVSPTERARLAHDTHSKMLMLAGEGSLLIGLLFVVNFALYRMLVGEWRLNRQRDSFVHAVTHELKSPIAGLRALLESLESLDLDAEDRAPLVDLGLSELRRLDAMVGNILLSTRLEAKGFTPKLETIDLDEVLGRIASRKERLFAEKDGTFEVAREAGRATFDAEAIDTVLENLVDNALKYGGDRPRVKVDVVRDDSRVVVRVQDGGIGLAEDERRRVFDRFYRAPSGERHAAKGTGLGLFIARGLARACGGDLTVESEGSGKGATFSLVLPKA